MRIAVFFALLVLPVTATAQSQSGADRKYPSLWVPLLKNLTKAKVDEMQASANQFCLGLDYTTVQDLYKDVSDCTLMQATAIMSVDSALSDFKYDPPTKYRPSQIKKCWALYSALGSKDVKNLDHCFGDIKHFELLQRVAGSNESPTRATPTSSAYCRKIFDASGGSYQIMEECMKQESAARRRISQ